MDKTEGTGMSNTLLVTIVELSNIIAKQAAIIAEQDKVVEDLQRYKDSKEIPF